MHGIGNDFVVVDDRSGSCTDKEDLARAVCDPRYGVGADGLIYVESTDLADVRMRMLNPDGSESEMCGNGLRCVARFVHPSIGSVSIETGGRVTFCDVIDDARVRVQMGVARVVQVALEVQGYEGVLVDIGNPHFVVFVSDVSKVALERVGPMLEVDPSFPQRANIHFSQVLDLHTVRQRTWERGAGITLACGSGACAGAVASVHRGLTSSPVAVNLPGGCLDIGVDANGEVVMTGPCETAFVGEWPG